MFGPLVVAYLFLGGVAGGAFFVMAAWSLLFHRRSGRSARMYQSFRSLQAACYSVAFVLLGLGVFFLLFDLGVPARALLVITRPHFTAITFGTYSLLAQDAVGLALSLVCALRLRVGGEVRRALEIVCLVTSTCVMVYTGVFLYNLASVAFWHSLILVGLFLVSSLSGGVSLVMLAAWFMQGKTLLLRTVRPLQRAHLVCLAVEAALIVAYLAHVATLPGVSGSFEILTSSDVLPVALIGVVGFGLVAPATLESYALSRPGERAIPVSDVICLMGCLCLRWIVIACGVH